MKPCIAVPLALLCLILAPAAAMADTPGDLTACAMDAVTFCSRFIPDRVRVAHCLKDNRGRLTPACREAIKHFK
jgi:hypothetical protein